jgi:site-specific recombinase XerD
MGRGHEIEAVLRRWESHLRVERNLSPRSRAAYLYDIGRLREWLAPDPEAPCPTVESVGAAHLRDYLRHLDEDLQQRPTTLARVISSLRGFFAFCVEERLLEVSPAEALQTPRRPRRLPVYLVRGEVQRLFAAPDTSTPQGLRDRAILLLLGFCGLRLQELVGLDLAAVDLASRSLRIDGKGSKQRLVPLNDDAAAALAAWLDARRAADGERAVFVNRRGTRLTGRMVQKIVDRHARAAGIDKEHFSPHKLRHTFATLLHGNDVDLVEIQTLLGHASITTTQIYTHTNSERLRGAVERLEVLGGGA